MVRSFSRLSFLFGSVFGSSFPTNACFGQMGDPAHLDLQPARNIEPAIQAY
jgi:hypothetical protein